MASPSPRVPPVTPATRPDRSKRSRASSASRVLVTVSAGSCSTATSSMVWFAMVLGAEVAGPWRGPPVGAQPERGDAVRRAVVVHVLGDDPGVEQQVEVAEHFPHHEHGLLADGAGRPQVTGDLVRGRRTAFQHGGDALAA